MTPYWQDETCALYLGDCRTVLPALGVRADLVLADPPYGVTSLPWDRWPAGWLEAVAGVTSSLWCFGTLRMYLRRASEFAGAGWKLSQDVIWEKPEGGFSPRDRFRCNHEQVTHWYRGLWRDIHHDPPGTVYGGPGKGIVHRGAAGAAWNGSRRAHTWTDDGTRISQTVMRVSHMRLRGIHPTEKPTGLLDPLITYACPPGGLVVDPFAGSGSALDAARCSGRRSIGIEADERCCELAARRLAQGTLEAAMGP